MSRSIDLFIDSDRPIEDLAAEVARLTGMTLQPDADASTWVLQEGDVRADLRAHPYSSDGELLLERYRYALGSRVGHGTRLLDAAETALLRLVSEALQRAGFATLLVHDLQYRDPGVSRPDSDRRPDGGGDGQPASGPAASRPAEAPA